MARYDHFRKWLVDQYSVSPPPARRAVRSPYALPSRPLPLPHQRLPDLPSPSLSVSPLGDRPSSPTPPLSSSQAAAPLLPRPELPFSSPPNSLDPYPLPESVETAPQGLGFVHSAALAPGPIRSPGRAISSNPEAFDPAPPDPKVQLRSARALRWCSCGLVILVWLGLLGVGGYALRRLLDPLFAQEQPAQEQPLEAPLPSRTDAEAPAVPIPAPVPPVPGPFDYADAVPRSTSPVWALVAIIVASALGSRVMLQQSPHAAHPMRDRRGTARVKVRP